LTQQLCTFQGNKSPLCHPQLQSLLAIPHTKGLSPVSTLFYTEDVGSRYVLNIDNTAHTHTVQSLNGGNKSFRLFVTCYNPCIICMFISWW